MRPTLDDQWGGKNRDLSALPLLVQRAMGLARTAGFSRSCLPEVGRLLSVLTHTVSNGTVGEIGTGYGVGTAWMAYGLAPSAHLVTVELDVQAAQAAASLFHGQDNVQVIAGDWRELLFHGPFRLLFIDARDAKANDPEPVLDALAPGGMAILDDFTPLDQWPEEWHGCPDPVRNFWLYNLRLASTEILVRPDSAVILAVRTASEKDTEDAPEDGSTPGLN